MSTAVAHRRALYGHNRNAAWQAYLEGELPEGYRRVDYIESTGVQWIDTGVVPGANDRYRCKFQLTVMPTDTYATAFGALVSNNYIGVFLALNYTVPVQARYGINTRPNIISELDVAVGVDYEVDLEFNKMSINGRTYYPESSNVWNFTVNTTMRIFGASGIGNARRNVAARFYRFTVDRSGQTIRCYIPCVRTSDFKPGMYDLCGSICPLTNSPFYVNAGTGADFLWKEFDGPHTDEVWYWAPEQVTLYSQTGVVSHTFSGGKGVVKFNAPVTTMGQALRGTTISDVRMPERINGIGIRAFSDCSELALRELPSSLTYINEYAFNNCTKLALTALPSGIVRIDRLAFSGCSNLALTSLPAGLTKIAYLTFNNNRLLALTELPSGITSIEAQAFINCPNLALTSLPSGVTSILGYTFATCTSITKMELPSGMTSMAAYAFNNCSGLAEVTFLGTPTSIEATAFNRCTNLTDIYVPWSEGDVANAPWGASNATIHYNHTAS